MLQSVYDWTAYMFPSITEDPIWFNIAHWLVSLHTYICTSPFYQLCTMLYYVYVPIDTFEFVSSDGIVTSTQNHYWCVVPPYDYEYVIFTHYNTKMIIHKRNKDLVFRGKHSSYVPDILPKTPFFSAEYVTIIDDVSVTVSIEFKTDTYNYLVKGNVIGPAIMRYFMNTHYPFASFNSNYKINILTTDFKSVVYTGNEPITI